MNFDYAPIRNKPSFEAPWEGNCHKKPWDYQVCAVIPVLDTYEQLNICVELLRRQTVSPFIIVIDTGSTDQELNKITSLRSDDLEVHSLRFNGVCHPSDLPAIAMDLAFSMCRNNFLFATHADVFVKEKICWKILLNFAKKNHQLLGTKYHLVRTTIGRVWFLIPQPCIICQLWIKLDLDGL